MSPTDSASTVPPAATPQEADKLLWWANVVFLGFIVVGLLASICSTSEASQAAVVVIWALACLAVGAFVGLLFGIPRVRQKTVVTETATGTDSGVRPAPKAQPEINNNLIEVSDWLTKIIVGLGLIELGSLPERLRTISAPLATCIGGESGLAVAVGVIVCFTAIGFLAGYVNAKTFLAGMFNLFDKRLLNEVDELRSQMKAIEDSASLPGKKTGSALPEGAADANLPTSPAPAAAFAPPLKHLAPAPLADAERPTEPLVPDDPNKGQFGGRPTANDRIVEATLQPVSGEKSAACKVEIVVRSTNPDRPLTGSVIFHLHPSFRYPRYPVKVREGVARTTFTSWGAFTVGALTDNGETKLELDLTTVPGGTQKFYAS